MKKILLTGLMILMATAAQAELYDFKGYMVDVEAWAGTGTNETILVVDWNRLDQEANGQDIVSQSHAFGYRWDDTAYESDMLTALNDAGILVVETGYGGAFVNNISFWDAEDNEVHTHIESGSWNLASTTDPNARWGTWGNSDWDFNTAGINEELLVDGQFEGINAIMWFGTLPDYADDQLDVPLAATPVPGTFWLLGAALLGITGMGRKQG